MFCDPPGFARNRWLLIFYTLVHWIACCNAALVREYAKDDVGVGREAREPHAEPGVSDLKPQSVKS